MQVTIEIPDDLARQLERERERLVEIIERGLREHGSGARSPVEEVFDFLAGRPAPDKVVAFRPSPQSVERLRELLDKNRDGSLTADEEAELDTLESLNDFFALIKVRARQQSGASA